MNASIQLGIPDSLRTQLEARAKQAGLSLSEYLIAELQQVADATSPRTTIALPFTRVVAGQGAPNFEAYDLYLRARFRWNERTERSIDQCVELLEEALRIDPHYATAWAALADAYVTQALTGAREPGEVIERARAAAQHALRLDSNAADALTVLACVAAIYDWSWVTSEQLFLQATVRNRLDPITYQWYALNLLMPLGRFAEAREQLTYAWGIDPNSPVMNVGTGILSYYARDYEAARDVCWQIIEAEPGFAMAHYFLGLSLEQLGEKMDCIEALTEAVHLSRRSTETVAALAHAHGIFGNVEDATSLAEELFERSRSQYVSPVQLAAVELGRGRKDAALNQLERAAEIHATELVWVGQRPVFDVLRGEPRFDVLLTQRLRFPSGS